MKLKMTRHPLAVTAALGALLAVASYPAMAGDQTARSVVVRYGDLDLSRDEGVAVLYGRLRSAARRVCSEANIRDLKVLTEVRQCHDAALTKAVASAGNTRLAALHESRGGRAQLVLPRIASMTAGS